MTPVFRRREPVAGRPTAHAGPTFAHVENGMLVSVERAEQPRTAQGNELRGGPGRLVIAEGDRGAGPAGWGFGQPDGGAEVAEAADRCVALDRPAVDVGLREFVRHVVQR